MDVFDAVLLSVTSFTALIIALGTVMSFVYRSKPIVKATNPLLTILADFLYLGMLGLSAQQVIEHQTLCPAFLWVPFTFAFLLGNTYAIKCVRLYVLAIIGQIKITEFHENAFYAPIVPDSLADTVLLEIDVEDGDPQNKDIFVRSSCTFKCDKWIYKHRWIGSLKFLWKPCLLVTLIELLIPLALNLVDPQYQNMRGMCTNRTNRELWLFMGIIGFYISIYVVTIIKIWKLKDYFGLRKQLFLSTLAWGIVFVVFFCIVMVQKNTDYHDGADKALAVFAIICWLLPFSSDTLWPLFRSGLNHEILKSRDMVGFQLGFDEIIQWKDTYKREAGWESLASYLAEHLSPADAQDNLFLLHGLFFVRDFIRKRNELVEFRGQDILQNKNHSLDKEIHGLVLLSWLKYLHKKGELIWDDQNDLDAVFLVNFGDIEKVRKEMEVALSKIVRTPHLVMLSDHEQALAGEKLREIYQKVVTKLEREVLEGFRKSVQFEHFLRIMKGQVSTIQ